MSEEKKALSQRQLDILSKHRTIHEQMAYLILNYLDTRDANYVKSIDRMLLENSKVKNKCFPRCHVLPMAAPNVFYMKHRISFDNPEFLDHVYHAVVSSRPNDLVQEAIDKNKIIVVVNEFVPLLCFGTMFDYLLKHTHKREIKEGITKALEKYGRNYYLVRPSRAVDACDIVACPDKRFIQSLPYVIQRRIENYDLQYDMQHLIKHPKQKL
jgi:hypothetical protein